jgi:hypothetical protein
LLLPPSLLQEFSRAARICTSLTKASKSAGTQPWQKLFEVRVHYL